jgi:hypothetical protein
VGKLAKNHNWVFVMRDRIGEGKRENRRKVRREEGGNGG